MKQTITRSFGHGQSESTLWQHPDGLLIGYGLSRTDRHETVSARSSMQDCIQLHFGTRGDYRFTHKQLGKTYDLIGGHHNLMYSPTFDLEVSNKTLEIETFGVNFTKDAFLHYAQHGTDTLKIFCDKVAAGQSVILTEHWGAIDTPIQQTLQEVLREGFTGRIEENFILSKALDLLVMCVETCTQAEHRATQADVFLRSKADKEKIIAARDYINLRLHEPPNLSEVSKEVGLNEYKLKRGFKETFGNTLFGYLTEQRLQWAYYQVIDSQYFAADIADRLGYATPQHFNNAFKKKFGFTPMTLKKSRKRNQSPEFGG